MDEIKFLKVKPGEATEIIDDMINKGYETLNKIRNDYGSNPAISGTRVDTWSSWLNEWGQEVMRKLNVIYISPSRASYFREKVTRTLPFTSDTAVTNFETTIDTKIEVLRGCYDFIMTTGRPSLTVHGDLVFQQGENIKYEKK